MAKIREFDINGSTFEIETSEPIEDRTGAGQTINDTLDPNKLYVYSTLSSLQFELGTPQDTDIVNEYHLQFIAESTVCNVIWPSTIAFWVGGSAPTIQGGKAYEVSIVNGWATVVEF